jgi:hypothetical protein
MISVLIPGRATASWNKCRDHRTSRAHALGALECAKYDVSKQVLGNLRRKPSGLCDNVELLGNDDNVVLSRQNPSRRRPEDGGVDPKRRVYSICAMSELPRQTQYTFEDVSGSDIHASNENASLRGFTLSACNIPKNKLSNKMITTCQSQHVVEGNPWSSSPLS